MLTQEIIHFPIEVRPDVKNGVWQYELTEEKGLTKLYNIIRYCIRTGLKAHTLVSPLNFKEFHSCSVLCPFTTLFVGVKDYGQCSVAFPYFVGGSGRWHV